MTPTRRPRLLLVVASLIALGLALSALRGGGVIAWPWWAVLLPIAAANALGVVVVLFVLAGSFLVEWRSARRRRQNRKSNQYQL